MIYFRWDDDNGLDVVILVEMLENGEIGKCLAVEWIGLLRDLREGLKRIDDLVIY